MQSASKQYKEQLKRHLRKNEYIQVTIGVINQTAQQSAVLGETENLAIWSATLLSENSAGFEYATPEENFSKVDGTMAFLPREENQITYRMAIVPNTVGGSIIFEFGEQNLDIRGLSINFGSNYPSEFKVSNGQYEYTYTNDSAYWKTDDLFLQSSCIRITPISMAHGQNRLRIYSIQFGVGVVFTNKEVVSFSNIDYVSPITDSIPSRDMSLKVANYGLEYSVDNPNSAINFLEKGQEIAVSFGQMLDDGSIEWIRETKAKLHDWSSDDREAVFFATDELDGYNSTYYKGLYRPDGISAYDLGIDIFEDMGCENYYLDPYLKNIIIRNPMPAVLHTEALQILANACRCAFSIARDGTLCIQSNFTPDMIASAADATDFSRPEDILNGEEKEWYAVPASDFSAVGANEAVYFLPRTESYKLNTGYMSNAVADGNGKFTVNPEITIHLESALRCYGMKINFHSIAPTQFVVHTYYDGALVEDKTITDIALETVISGEFKQFDEVVIEFTKGYPNSRIVVDNIAFEDTTDYELTYDKDLTDAPQATLQEKLRSISVVETIYSETTDPEKTLIDGKGYVSPEENTITVYFSNPSYNLSVVSKTDGITCRIKESSNYFAVIEFAGMSEQIFVEYTVSGKEYAVNESVFTKNHNSSGADYRWNNPLVDNTVMARDLEEWLAVYYDANVEYQAPYRGDPRIDADDLMYMELKDRSAALVKGYQHTLEFNGAWSGIIKARKVRNVYRTWDEVKAEYTWNTLYASGITWSKLKARI